MNEKEKVQKERFRDIRVLPHDPKWIEDYTEELKILAPLFTDNMIASHHIGSTAIPDLPAKPVIDILMVVKDHAKVDAINSKMEALGYHPMGEYGIPERRYFWKDDHRVHLHCYLEGNPEIEKYLTIRDFLIAHPKAAEEYGIAKIHSAEKHPRDGHAYNRAKKEIVEKFLEHAIEWQNKGPGDDTVYPIPKVGRTVCFLKNVITNPNIQIGDYTYYHDYNDAHLFEKNNLIYHEKILNDKLIIGKFCQIAMGVQFIMNASQHQMSGFSTYPFAIFNKNWAESYDYDFPVAGDTIVGNDVWIGYNACIRPGVKIGDGAIIATSSLVTKDVPPYTIVGGNPAKIIRQRFEDDVIDELLDIRWWDWPIEKILQHLPEITGADIRKLRDLAAE